MFPNFMDKERLRAKLPVTFSERFLMRVPNTNNLIPFDQNMFALLTLR
jgi:hypothetical protein